MLVVLVLDSDGVWHEVYNKTEICVISKSCGWVEKWQVRTLCCRDKKPEFLEPSIRRATIDDSERAGHVPTCVRCLCLPCDHGVSFDEARARLLNAHQVRKQWPRLDGPCSKGCGYDGIFYASYTHYIYGDW